MSREITLEVPMDIPASPKAIIQFRGWLESVTNGGHIMGADGREVGVGFHWQTRTGFDNRKLYLITRRVKRVLKSANVISYACDPYNLEQRITYVRDGDGKATLVIKED